MSPLFLILILLPLCLANIDFNDKKTQMILCGVAAGLVVLFASSILFCFCCGGKNSRKRRKGWLAQQNEEEVQMAAQSSERLAQNQEERQTNAEQLRQKYNLPPSQK